MACRLLSAMRAYRPLHARRVAARPAAPPAWPHHGTRRRGLSATSAGTGGSGESAPAKARIYTRTGDAGTSQLYSGQRRGKADAVFQALGDTDELNSHLGVALQHASAARGTLAPQLEQVQSRLLDVGSAIATPISQSSERKLQRVSFPEIEVEAVEAWIDELDDKLPPLMNFILPSGGALSAQLHLARTVCRRAERRVVALGPDDVEVSVQRYLNRLSDYLFTAARFAAQEDGVPEVVYKKARD